MADTPPGIRTTTRLSLDALIGIEHDKKPFDILVVAFDSQPANQNLLPNSCLRTEVNFVLRAFAGSKVLPTTFARESAALIEHYKKDPKHPRGPGRPPRIRVDALYMDPMFEALVLSDMAAWRGVFGLKSSPKDWPSIKRSDRHLDQLMAKLIEVGKAVKGAKVPPYLHGDAKANKHAFALEAIRNAGSSSPLWRHAIAVRLAELLG